MISVPSCYDVLCRISYKDSSVIQRSNLSSFRTLKAQLPKNSRIDMLIYKQNAVYGWAPLRDAVVTEDVMTMIYWATNVRTVNLLIPYKQKHTFVTLPDRFFLDRQLTPQEYLLGLLSSSVIKDYEIIVPFKKRSSVNIRNYLLHGDMLNRFNPRWILNGRELDYKYYMDSIEDIVEEYLTDFYVPTVDAYKTHQMIRSSYLLPLMFSKENNLKGVELRVPYEAYWLFHLLYGRKNRVFSQLPEGDVDIDTLTVGKGKSWIKVPKISVELLKSETCTPVYISGNFTMRFRE